MTDLDLAALRETAEAATQGPWTVDGPLWNQIVWSAAENRVCLLAHSSGLDDERDAATGAFIAAANPAVVLTLLDAVEKAEATVTGCLVTMVSMADAEKAATAEISRLRALLAKAGEALEPFAAACDDLAKYGWYVPILKGCDVDQHLAARAVLAEIKEATSHG